MKISSIGKKVGIAAGIAGAAALTTLAYVKGKQNLLETDKFVNSSAVKKTGMAIGEGFMQIARNLQLAFAKFKAKSIIDGALTDKDIQKLNEVDARVAFDKFAK